MLRTFRLFSPKIFQKASSISYSSIYKFCSASQSSHSQTTLKGDVSDMSSEYITLFQRINLESKLINNTLPNAKLSSSLAGLCQRLDISQCDKKKGILLYTIASKLTTFPKEKQDLLAQFVLNDKITSAEQLDRAIAFAKSTTEGPSTPGFTKKLEEHCGIGIEFTDELIRKTVQKYIQTEIQQTQTTANVNKANHLKALRDLLPGATGGTLYQIFHDELGKVIKEETSPENNEKETQKPFSASRKIFNLFARDITSSVNPPDLLKKHLEATGGKIITRFPPEPNGFLHLGHAKAMRFSFTAAKEQNGLCNLRYDDTNPLTESKEYIDNIEENVRWLGYTPTKITHASDYFQQLFDFAIILIKKGKAYICEQKQEEMQAFRSEKKPSPWRDRSPDESLDLFLRMRAGEFEESRYCLRLKIDHASENPTLRDPVAFRVKKHPHPQTGTKWCIFPTYDFTHGVSDSLENITHSLCTLEFEIRRDLYYWILEALEIYRPMVWEFSRLNVTRTVLSKRKLNRLIQAGFVKGWDDPRLLTINGMRRRGFTPSGINSFCDEISVTRRGNETMMSIQLLESCIRKDLDQSSKRTMAVLSPVKVTITNLGKEKSTEVQMYPFPKDKTKEEPYKIALSQEIFIEKSDVREEDEANFYGLAPGKVVGLRYANFIKCTDIIKDGKGEIVEVKAEMIVPETAEEIEELKKVKGRIHWISALDAIDCEARLYDYLFTVDNPNEVDNFMDVVNKDSMKVLQTLKFNKRLLPKAQIESKFQFERLGYFCIDKDSDFENGKLVFNRTMELNEKDKIKAIGKDQK